MTPFYKHKIAEHQLKVQLKGIQAAIVEIEVDMHPDSASSVWVTRDNLKTQERNLKQLIKSWEQAPHKKQGIIDKMILAIYSWATRDRFT